LPYEFEDVGIVLFEGGLRGSQAPLRDSDDINGNFPANTNQGVSLLDYFPVGCGNGVREEVSVEHTNRPGKIGRQTIIDGFIKSDEAFCSA